MNQYDWDALKWISENTPKDAWIYYFYSDTLANNAPLYNSKRVSFNIRPKSFIEGLQSQEIKKMALRHYRETCTRQRRIKTQNKRYTVSYSAACVSAFRK